MRNTVPDGVLEEGDRRRMKNVDLAELENVARVVALSATGAPGACVSLIVDGQALPTIAVGSSDLHGQHPLAPDAVFYVYSVTKLVIAVLVVELEAEGRINLEDRLVAHLPELEISAGITVRHALNHTSGLPDYGATREYQSALERNPTRPWTAEMFLEHAARQGALFAPGEGWAYSNLGYALLKRLLERLVGEAFNAILERRVFAPLGLTKSFAVRSLEDAAPVTPGWSSALSGTPENIVPRYHPGWVAHGLIASNAPELARLIEAVFTGDLTSRLRESVGVPGSHPLFTQTRYGLGLMIDPSSRFEEMAGHNGGGPGFSASAFHFADVNGHHVSGVALLNTDPPDDLAQRVLLEVVSHLELVLAHP
jgi:D-alanyl-D-alanine carboxypeptidase